MRPAILPDILRISAVADRRIKMDEIYRAVANLPDGKKLVFKGTIMQCSDWADHVIRDHGACEITIRRVIKLGGWK